MILHLYFARRFIMTLGGVTAIFAVMLAFLDLVEQLRSFQGADVSFGSIVQLTMLNLPQGLYRIFPLIVILATIALFLGLARTSEMVVTRAAGRSALRALRAPVAVIAVVGILGVAAFNPIVAATSTEYETRAEELSGSGSVLALATDGLWLRQGSETGQTVIRAHAANLDGTRLSGVSFITFTFDGGPVRRIEADSAELQNGHWLISNAKLWPLGETRNPEAAAELHETYEVPSTLTADQIRNSFGVPSSIPIWELPGFINRLKTAGFSARRHEIWMQTELAMPLFLIAMVLVGAAFTMRHQRGGKTGIMVLYAILLSFGLYFVRNFASILGENGQLPVLLAAWAPPLVAIGLALGLLLHLEDG